MTILALVLDGLQIELAEEKKQTGNLFEDLHFAREEREKYYVKARVYGAIAAKYNVTLTAILNALDQTCNTARGLAREALEWRHSVNGGVPMSAVEEIGRLLDPMCEGGDPPEGSRLWRAELELRKARLQVEELRKRLENGQAAHRDDRAARDFLARENARLKAELEGRTE